MNPSRATLVLSRSSRVTEDTPATGKQKEASFEVREEKRKTKQKREGRGALIKTTTRLLLTVFVSLMAFGFVLTPEMVYAQDEPEFDIGGALRWNYFVKSWDDGTKATWGRWAMDTFRFNIDGSYKDVYLSAEYRFYAGYQMIHHGYLGYDFNESTSMHLGVHQVPFGIQPYASHNWFFQLPYYVGLEDDYDAGIKFLKDMGNFHLAVAYYLNDEGNYTGNSIASARYSYDVVPTAAGTMPDGVARTQMENNQFNIRLAMDVGEHEIGVSGQYGMLYNTALDENGSRMAWGVHGNLNFGQLNMKLEAIGYSFDPELAPGVDETVVAQGAYDYPYLIAAEAMFYVAGVSYSVPVEIGPISNLTFYENFCHMDKPEENFEASQNAITGVMVTAGSVYTYIDYAMGKNHPWIGPVYGNALAQGNPDAEWEYRFNVNIGYYF